MPELNEQHKKFCMEYLIDFHITNAAIRAGYKEKSAHVQGSRLLKNAKIKEYIHTLTQEIFEHMIINDYRVLAEYAHQAFCDPLHYYNDEYKLKPLQDLTRNQRSCIHSIEVKEWTGGAEGRASSREVKFKLYDKQKALDKIGQHLGLFTEKPDGNQDDNKLPPITFNVNTNGNADGGK